MIEVTEWAREILQKADAAARRLNPDARVRLSVAPAPRTELRAKVPEGALRTELVEGPEPGDASLEIGEAVIYVERDIEGLLDVEEPHDRIVMKPAGSEPSVRH